MCGMGPLRRPAPASASASASAGNALLRERKCSRAEGSARNASEWRSAPPRRAPHSHHFRCCCCTRNRVRARDRCSPHRVAASRSPYTSAELALRPTRTPVPLPACRLVDLRRASPACALLRCPRPPASRPLATRVVGERGAQSDCPFGCHPCPSARGGVDSNNDAIGDSIKEQENILTENKNFSHLNSGRTIKQINGLVTVISYLKSVECFGERRRALEERELLGGQLRHTHLERALLHQVRCGRTAERRGRSGLRLRVLLVAHRAELGAPPEDEHEHEADEHHEDQAEQERDEHVQDAGRAGARARVRDRRGGVCVRAGAGARAAGRLGQRVQRRAHCP